MANLLHCWIAEHILPLTEDGRVAREAAEWLAAHGRACARHRPRRQSAAAFGPDAKIQAEALARVSAAWHKEEPRAEGTFASWFNELAAEWRLAPMPMAALSAVALAIGLLQHGQFLR